MEKKGSCLTHGIFYAANFTHCRLHRVPFSLLTLQLCRFLKDKRNTCLRVFMFPDPSRTCSRSFDNLTSLFSRVWTGKCTLILETPAKTRDSLFSLI